MPSARKRDNHFSEENWSAAATRYQGSIKNLLGDSWDSINDGAWKIAQVKRGGRIALSNPDGVLMPETDERELLVEAEEAVENDEIDWEICEFLFLLRVSSVADWYDGVTELEQNRAH